MTAINDSRVEVLKLIAEESYAHARDHENLRAQVTSTLVAAAFVLVGLAVDKELSGPPMCLVSLAVIAIGVLNLRVVCLHNNRFVMHVTIAKQARGMIDNVTIQSEIEKKGHLSHVWAAIASLPVFAGAALLCITWYR